MNIETEFDRAAADTYNLAEQRLNPQWVNVLRILGMDKTFVRAEGCCLYDAQGNPFLDFHSGEGVASIGHNHPKVAAALKAAIDGAWPDGVQIHYSPLSGLLAERLTKRLPDGLDAVYFCNTGAETVETAIKFARKATRRSRIVSCERGYHGLTLGALSIVGDDEFKHGFGPLLPGCETIPFNNLDALEQQLKGRDVAAFVTEPIQGRTVAVPDAAYLPAAQQLCRKYGTLFVLDEVQTGLGRTGAFCALEHWQLEPDIVLLAKALSGGYVPVGALVTRRDIHKRVFNSLDNAYVHHSTYGRNRLAMAAGLATLDVLVEDGLIENAQRIGQRIVDGLRIFRDRYEMVKAVRGRGLMIGIEFGPPKGLRQRISWKAIHAAAEGLFAQLIVIPLMRDHRVISMVSGRNDVIKFLPPLSLSEAQADQFLAALDHVLHECHQSTRNWQLVLDIAKKTAQAKLGLGRSSRDAEPPA